MASACCVHQISSAPVGSNGLKQQPIWPCSSFLARNATVLFRLPKLASANAGRAAVCASIFRTIATTPDSEVGASDVEEAVKDESKALDAEDEEQKPAKFDKKTKSLVHILEVLHQQAIEEATKDKEIPDIRPGYVVQIRIDAPETKRRVALLRGIVICRRNNGGNTTFTIRRMIAGVGVEMVIPLYSPNIQEITVLKKTKVRRAKLYYLRKKLAKFSTF